MATQGKCGIVIPLYHNQPGQRSVDSIVEEAVGLAAAIDLVVTFTETQVIRERRPSTVFGKGKVEELAKKIAVHQLELVIVDDAITPVQQRNLEKAWDCKVIDRTALILEIFGERARTREGRLQVELAALTYQKGRLVRSWTHLERQRGGAGFMGGPGETQIEADRRMIAERITKLKQQLQQVTKTRRLHRASRDKVPYPIIALVGYTNAGKSTLFNKLTGAKVHVQDQLFATLDPTMRAITLPSGIRAILSDTVGFVSNLPHELVAAFRATLEEVIEADLILHVRDIANHDTDAQKQDVLDILSDLLPEHDHAIKVLEVHNKVDLLKQKPEIRNQKSDFLTSDFRLPISALTGEGLENLLQVADNKLQQLLGYEQHILTLNASEGKKLAWLHAHAHVLEQNEMEDSLRLKINIRKEDWEKFARV